MTKPSLDQERKVFEEHLDAWLVAGKVGQTVVIKGETVVGFFPSAEVAFEAAVKTYGEIPFFMSSILPRDATNTTFLGRAI